MHKRFSNAKDSDYDFSEPCKLTRQQRQTENLRQSWFDSNTRHMGIKTTIRLFGVIGNTNDL